MGPKRDRQISKPDCVKYRTVSYIPCAGKCVCNTFFDINNPADPGSHNSLEIKERESILNWLTAVDYGSQKSDFLCRQQEGTGQWLLDSIEFQKWVTEPKQTLFAAGIPGAGKTILASIVIDYLERKFQHDNSVEVIYFYCNFGQHHEQKPVHFLASLLKQLVQRQPSIPQNVRDLYNRHTDKKTRPPLDEISKVLHSVIVNYSRVFVVVDALDELQVINGARARLLSQLSHLRSKTKANMFATSRFIPEIVHEFKAAILLEIYASSEDVVRYIDGHMSQLPYFVFQSRPMQEAIKNRIVTAVDGMQVLFPCLFLACPNSWLTFTQVSPRRALSEFINRQDLTQQDETCVGEPPQGVKCLGLRL